MASVVPFVALLVLNVSLVREVRRSTRYLEQHVSAVASTAQRDELQISVMLISVVVVFFVCQVYTTSPSPCSARHDTTENAGVENAIRAKLQG